MYCPFCGFEDQEVLNTRTTYKGFATWRRRKCLNCAEIFTTHEYINLTYIKVIKKSGTTKVYSRAKLFSGIYIAFRNIKHMDSGDAAVFAETVTRDIERSLISRKINKITTLDLSQDIAQILHKKSYPAFVNYTNYFFTPEMVKKTLNNSKG